MASVAKDGTFPSICRLCHNYCGILVTVEDGRVVRLKGDRLNSSSGGYTCVKGRALPDMLNGKDRRQHPLKRVDGVLAPIDSGSAMEEIAAKIAALVEQHGPRSIALYIGTQAFLGTPINWPIADSFGEGLGAIMCDSSTIDQPGKAVAGALHGTWNAPSRSILDADVGLYVGMNPMISRGFGPMQNPNQWIKQAKQDGTKLIVIDPRKTEIADHAFLHLQPIPGEDIAILSAILKVIFDEGLEDQEFLAANVDGVEALRAGVAPYDAESVARRAGISEEDIRLAARTIGATRRLWAGGGTGTNMAQSGTVVEYLLLALQTVSGAWLREGDPVPNPGTLVPAFPTVAQAIPPIPAIGVGLPMRVHDFVPSIAGVQTAAIPDEILLEGEGQIRALISVGGNPAVAWPDQLKTVEALNKLELLVQIDPYMSQTSQLADYVIPTRLCLESPMTNQLDDMVIALAGKSLIKGDAFGQHAPALVDPPAGSDLVEEWEFFFTLARHLGMQMTLKPLVAWSENEPYELDMERTYSPDELLEIFNQGTRVPFAEIKKHPHGASFADPSLRVSGKPEGWTGRLDIGNPDILRDLRQNLEVETVAEAARFPYRILSRRLNHVYNSSYNFPKLNKGRSYNPAFMHPSDLEGLGLEDGDTIRIASRRAAVVAIVEGDATMRPGSVSLTHAFGSNDPEQDLDVVNVGTPTSRLCSMDLGFDRYQGQPLMSNIPVNIRKVDKAPSRSSDGLAAGDD
jgi:anaerobic selenocysteine-containing dehydrogenase